MRKNKIYFIYILLAIMLIILTTWVVTIVKGNMPYIDQWTRGFVGFVADTRVYPIARLLTELGSASFLIPFTVILAVVLYWLFRDWLPVLLFTGGVLGSHLINILIKWFVARERPRIYIAANAEGYSFPSGHAMISMVCYGFLMYLLTKKLVSMKFKMILQICFALLIFLIGLSRYIINVHYLTDVLTGFIIGFFILIGLIRLFEYIQRRRQQTDSY